MVFNIQYSKLTGVTRAAGRSLCVIVLSVFVCALALISPGPVFD
jgi:hypothetical protein